MENRGILKVLQSRGLIDDKVYDKVSSVGYKDPIGSLVNLGYNK